MCVPDRRLCKGELNPSAVSHIHARWWRFSSFHATQTVGTYQSGSLCSVPRPHIKGSMSEQVGGTSHAVPVSAACRMSPFFSFLAVYSLSVSFSLPHFG